jgi:hypothetical protein
MSANVERFKKHLLASIAACGIGLAVPATSATAGGCNGTCHSCQPTTHPDCRCNCSKPHLGHSISKAMKSFADGMGDWFSFGKSGGCDEVGCDDACDAAMMEELMTPLPPHHGGNPHVSPYDYGHPHPHPHSGHMLEPPVAPMPSVEPMQTMPMQPMQPPIESIQPMEPMRPMQPEDVLPRGEPSARPLPEPQRPAPAADTPEEGSLFDSLSDPFQDDEARRSSRRTVRPSSYEQRSRPRPTSSRSHLHHPMPRSRHWTGR